MIRVVPAPPAIIIRKRIYSTYPNNAVDELKRKAQRQNTPLAVDTDAESEALVGADCSGAFYAVFVAEASTLYNSIRL